MKSKEDIFKALVAGDKPKRVVDGIKKQQVKPNDKDVFSGLVSRLKQKQVKP